jgi:hypothetical protein
MNGPWSGIPAASERDPLEIALAEIEVAIELVRRGQARRVRLVGLAAAEEAAGLGLARAQAAGVRFAIERSTEPGQAISVVIGPTIDG